mmetsp:Transcript_31752/g.51413  ORF Transcript_31752/g.51413 Transcript_31752/m.51413 type:complete len:121 (+) Transcript_31752:2063-2425(+)
MYSCCLILYVLNSCSSETMLPDKKLILFFVFSRGYDVVMWGTTVRLICIFEKTWKVVVHKDVESYSIRVICDKANFPEVDALLTVFWDEKKEVSIVEFRNLNSSYFEFQNFFEGVRSEYF